MAHSYGYLRSFGKNYGDAPDSDITSVGYMTFDGKGQGGRLSTDKQEWVL